MAERIGPGRRLILLWQEMSLWARAATSIVVFATTLAGVWLGAYQLGNRRGQESALVRSLPVRVAAVEDSLFTTQLPRRMRAVEARLDTIQTSGSLPTREALRQVREIKEDVNRILCLIEVERGRRAALDCR